MKYATHTIILLVSLLLAGTALAQSELEELQHTSPQQRANAQTAFMKQKLNLTSEQEPKVAAINLKYAKEIDPILKGPEGEFRKALQIRRLEDEKENELKGVLTPGQFQTFLASKEQLRQKVLEAARAH